MYLQFSSVLGILLIFTCCCLRTAAASKIVLEERIAESLRERSLPPIRASLPNGFVYLSDVDPTIVQAVRYNGPENAIGRPMAGYKRNTVVVTRACAEKLRTIQQRLTGASAASSLSALGLSLVVYDAYRPRKAVDDFWQWAHLPPLDPSSTGYDPDAMGPRYFPGFCGPKCGANLTRADLFQKGYISKKSNHARGSTVDVTIVANTRHHKEAVRNGSMTLLPLVTRAMDSTMPVAEPYDEAIRSYLWPKLSEEQRAFLSKIEVAFDCHQREGCKTDSSSLSNRSLPFLDDKSVDMGSSFDLFDPASHPIWPGHFLPKQGKQPSSAFYHLESPPDVQHPTFILRRLMLQAVFEEEGFLISDEEWWHFWMKDGEPFPPKPDEPEYGFDFDVV